MPPATKVGH